MKKKKKRREIYQAPDQMANQSKKDKNSPIRIIQSSVIVRTRKIMHESKTIEEALLVNIPCIKEFVKGLEFKLERI